MLNKWAGRAPQVVETLYARKFFKSVNLPLSMVTGLFPISIAEFVLIGLIVFLIVRGFKTVMHFKQHKEKRKQIVVTIIANTLIMVSVINIAFILLWGLNYSRLPFADMSGLEIKPTSAVELGELNQSLIVQANALRSTVEEDARGVFRISRGRDSVFNNAQVGFTNASDVYPQLGGMYGRPKGVMLSTLMSYAGISGVYFPFTAEANVNVAIPDVVLPSTTCHEMSHQRGFAREDEANFLAYVTCLVHPDPDFQYSGTLLALMHAMSALRKYDQETYLQLRQEYGEGLKRDLADLGRFWEQYEGPFERLSNRINDTYLKANGQEDGVQSYGRMVDLLLAARRSSK